MAVGLRLGTNLCDQHRCPCGTMVNCRDTHGLSCKRSSARIARHSYINDIIHYINDIIHYINDIIHYINDIIHCALVRAKIASVKEPVGLSRTDGKHLYGLTLIPWQVGKNLV